METDSTRDKDLFSPGEVAEALTGLIGRRVTSQHVRDWARRGRSPGGILPAYQRVGGMACFTRDAIRQIAADLGEAIQLGRWQPSNVGRPSLQQPTPANTAFGRMWAEAAADDLPVDESGPHGDIVALITADDRARQMMCGVEDPAHIAGLWAAEGFTAADVEAWMEAEVFTEAAARRLADAGISPEQAATIVTVRGTVMTAGYAVANGDWGTGDVAKVLEER